jgi:hypothetical protein
MTGMPRRRGRPAPLSAGVVEGFYGPPWRHEERLALLDAAPSLGLGTFLYAPKDDPWHRECWREPYPDAELARLGELAARAAAAGVALVWSVAPGLSMRYADDAEHAALVAKAEQVRGAGVPDVWLLFDDVPDTLADPDDVAAFGPGAAGAGRAHGETARRFRERFLLPHGMTHPMTVCPTDYAGCGRSPYRDGLAERLPGDARVLWTGADIVVGAVTRADVTAAAAAFGRRLVLWDNFPVNDFDRTRLFLGPLTGRPERVDDLPLDGVVANAMIEPVPSRLPLATVGAWARDPEAYDPGRAAAAALTLVAGQHAALVAPLVRACGSWPPAAPRDPALADATARALAGDEAALTAVEQRMRALAAGVPADDDRGDPLVAALAPWLAAGVHAGEAGLAACALLRGGAAADRAAAEAALDRVETDFPDVLRADVAAFVRATLGDDAPTAPPGRRAALVTGARPTPGDRAAVGWLRSRGFDARTTAVWPPAGGAPELAVLTPRAPLDAAAALADAPVPVLAWGRLVTLGVAAESGVLLDRDRVLPAGGGEVVVHRGPGRLTWCEPVPGAAVLARAPEPEPRPVLVAVPAGVPLTTGRPAAARRVVVFLTDDGPARWLLTDDGRALLDGALDRLVSARTAG